MKKYLLATASLFLYCLTYSQSPFFDWAKGMGSTTSDWGKSIAVDVSGNVYTIGYYNGTVDFDPGAGIFNLNFSGLYDIFISKLDNAGNFVWAKQMGGVDSDFGFSIAVDASGNVYTTGSFYGTADFDPGAGTFNLSSAGNSDVFISKLDNTGKFVWAKQMEGIDSGFGLSITTDASGNVYTTGYFEGTVDFDPGAGTFDLNSVGSDDIFISKLDNTGNFVWAKRMGSTSSDQGQSLTLDASGNVYTTGHFGGTVDFDPGAGTFNISAIGGNDIFISKLDNAGDFVWAKQMGGVDSDFGFSIAVDASESVYTTGSFEGTADFDPGVSIFNLNADGYNDIFISKLDNEGDFVWTKQIKGSNDESGKSITIDASGNIYTTGYFRGTVDFDPGAGTFDLNSVGSDDIFISKLDNTGNFLWAKQIGGSFDDAGNSIAVDASENVYTTGYYYSAGDFDPGTAVYNLNSTGGTDIFVHKLSNSVTGIVTNTLLSGFNIYPNPASTSDELTVDSFISPVKSLELYNIHGAIVKKTDNNTMKLTGISGGLYLLRIISNSNTISTTFLIK